MEKTLNKLSVVIPAYNEEMRIGTSLETIIRYFETQPFELEIIVVNDGSQDSTEDVVGAYAKRFSCVVLLSFDRNRGKGAAVARGVKEASGEAILFSDADLSTPIEEFEVLFEAFNAAYEVVAGSRSLPSSAVIKSQAFYRVFGGKIFNVCVRLCVLPTYKDTQCGFKLFELGAAQKIFSLQKISGFCFDVECLYLAEKLGFAHKEVPVRWINSEDTRVTTAGALKAFVDIVKIRLYDLAGAYKV